MAHKHNCHQCRRYSDAVHYCTFVKKNGNPCKLKYCTTCLIKRYEKSELEKASVLDNWVCLKCQNKCNCSECMRNRGQEPTGRFRDGIPQNNFGPDQQPGTSRSSSKPASSNPKRKKLEMAECAQEQLMELEAKESLLPSGVILTKVAGVDLAVEDVGPGLQFLEYSRVFSQSFLLKDKEPENILKEIANPHVQSSLQKSDLEDLQTSLLATIKKTKRGAEDGNNWLVDMKRLVSSKPIFKDLPPNCFEDASLYHGLDSNWKLHILNFLCDSALSDNQKLRSFIPKESHRMTEIRWEVLPSSQKIIAARHNLKEEEAKSMKLLGDGVILTPDQEEHELKLSRLKEELHEAYLHMLDTLKDVNLEQQLEANKAKRLMFDGNGRVFWKMEGYVEGSNILVQDFGNWDQMTCDGQTEKWFFFSKEEEQVIQNHISSKRIWEAILQRTHKQLHRGKSKRQRAQLEDQEELKSVCKSPRMEESDDEMTESDDEMTESDNEMTQSDTDV